MNEPTFEELAKAIESLDRRMVVVAETVIKLASHITRYDNLTICPTCHEQVMRTMRCPYCLALSPDHKRITAMK